MIRRRSTLGDTILLTLLALAFFVIAWRQEGWPMPIRLMLAGVGVFFLALAIYAAVVWIELNAAEVRRAQTLASPEIMLAEKISRWNPDTATAFMQWRIPIETIIAGETGPLRLLRCSDQDVPLSFIEEWLPRGKGDYLPAIRDLTSDRDRNYASAFESFAYQRGWIELPAGNQPARWVNYGGFEKSVYGAT
jgi:hypothetical protein